MFKVRDYLNLKKMLLKLVPYLYIFISHLLHSSSSFVSSNRILPFVFRFFAFSLNFRRSSKVQRCASNGHCDICFVVSGA